MPFLVAELGPDVDSFVLHLFAALAQKERALISARTRQALSAAKACGVTLGNPRLRVVRKSAVDAVKSEAYRYAANVFRSPARARRLAHAHREKSPRYSLAAKEATQTIPIVFLIEFADTALIRDMMSGASSSRTP
jgi:DNA invertase Pin-like site-specific DNA recombinase